MNPTQTERIDTLLTQLGLPRPQQYELYQQALTHSSYSYENQHSALENFERLEFLGDAVLKLIVSRYLFQRFPEYREGDLTKIRAVIVSDTHLARLSRRIGLGEFIVLGVSEQKSGGAEKTSNLACALEALLGALFLDGRMAETETWLIGLLENEVTEIDLSKTKDNYKAVLQEMTQGDGMGLPQYRTASEAGPAHNRTFTVEVMIRGEVVGIGHGKSKKEAQQHAARQALEVLNELEE